MPGGQHCSKDWTIQLLVKQIIITQPMKRQTDIKSMETWVAKKWIDLYAIT